MKSLQNDSLILICLRPRMQTQIIFISWHRTHLVLPHNTCVLTCYFMHIVCNPISCGVVVLKYNCTTWQLDPLSDVSSKVVFDIMRIPRIWYNTIRYNQCSISICKKIMVRHIIKFILYFSQKNDLHRDSTVSLWDDYFFRQEGKKHKFKRTRTTWCPIQCEH